MSDDLGLYDSDTGQSLFPIAVADFGHDETGEPLAVWYSEAKRGRIAQIRCGSLRVHYFVDESMIDEDADRIGRWLEMDGKDAVRLIRERAPAKQRRRSGCLVMQRARSAQR